MKSVRIIETNYEKDAINKIFNVEITINSDLGTFTGKASCHPDDYDTYSSSSLGHDLAYTRALIKFQKEKIKITKAQIKAVESVMTQVNYRLPSPKDNGYCKYIINHELNIMKENLVCEFMKLAMLESNAAAAFENHKEIVDKIREKAEYYLNNNWRNVLDED